MTRRHINITLIVLLVLLVGLSVALTANMVRHFSIRSVSGVPLPEKDTIYISSDIKDLTISGINRGDSSSYSIPKESRREVPVETAPVPRNVSLKEADIKKLRGDNPFYNEISRIFNGHLEENDSLNRHLIVNYCEHFRLSYSTRDIDFLRQIFSDNALIIVGQTVRTGSSASGKLGNEKVRYFLRSKSEYLAALEKVFASNRKIDVKFSEFRILRHPTMEGIYGVSLRQAFHTDLYSDDGYLFFLWDFRNSSMPQIYVRTWQPTDRLTGADDIIDISDFNLN